jgi:uncharacterized phiE125 gp8 family phage protein
MPYVQTSQPSVEPLSLAEAKAHLRVDTSRDDTYIQALITTSRLQIEDTFALVYVHQTWSYTLDAWPDAPAIELPVGPVAQILAIRTYDVNDIQTPIPLATFQLDAASRVPRLIRKATFAIPSNLRPANGIEVSFRAGYGAAANSAPEPLRHALRLLVAHWYDHRDPAAVTMPGAKVPASVSALLAPYRRPRIV